MFSCRSCWTLARRVRVLWQWTYPKQSFRFMPSAVRLTEIDRLPGNLPLACLGRFLLRNLLSWKRQEIAGQIAILHVQSRSPSPCGGSKQLLRGSIAGPHMRLQPTPTPLNVLLDQTIQHPSCQSLPTSCRGNGDLPDEKHLRSIGDKKAGYESK